MARQNHRCLWWHFQMGWLLLRLLIDALGHSEHWKVTELLLACIAPASFGFTSWEFCWNLWGLRRPSLVHWPLVGLEDWPYIFCHRPGFEGAALLGRQSAVMPRGATEAFATETFDPPRDQSHQSCWCSLKTSPTIGYVSRGECSAAWQSLGKPHYLYMVSRGNAISYLVQEPINFTLYHRILFRCHKHIACSIQAWRMVLMLFIVFLLLKQAHLATFKPILQNLVQGIIVTTKPRKLHLPTVKQLFCGWECHDFEVSGV